MNHRLHSGLRVLALTALLSSCSIAPPAEHRFGPLQTPSGIVFKLHAPAATRVQVVGSWEGNAWGGIAEQGQWLDPNRGVLRDPEGDGDWTRTIPLLPGRYLYQFVIDGHLWIIDPENPERTRWHGAETSILVVRSFPTGEEQER